MEWVRSFFATLLPSDNGHSEPAKRHVTVSSAHQSIAVTRRNSPDAREGVDDAMPAVAGTSAVADYDYIMDTNTQFLYCHISKTSRPVGLASG